MQKEFLRRPFFVVLRKKKRVKVCAEGLTEVYFTPDPVIIKNQGLE
jgi:hypothetical protein